MYHVLCLSTIPQITNITYGLLEREIRILMYSTFHEILTRAINRESKWFVLVFNFREFNKIEKSSFCLKLVDNYDIYLFYNQEENYTVTKV